MNTEDTKILLFL